MASLEEELQNLLVALAVCGSNMSGNVKQQKLYKLYILVRDKSLELHDNNEFKKIRNTFNFPHRYV